MSIAGGGGGGDQCLFRWEVQCTKVSVPPWCSLAQLSHFCFFSYDHRRALVCAMFC